MANPTSIPELVEAASAFGAHGILARYHAPVAFTAQQEARVERVVPSALSRPILTELRRRRAPAEVTGERLRRTATATDLLRVAVSRASKAPHRQRQMMHLLHARFDAGVERPLTSADGAFFVALGTAPRALRKARQIGVPTVVDVPVAHAAWVRRTMREEARLVPKYAVTLQGHDFPDWMLAANAQEFQVADVLLVLSDHERKTLVEYGVDEAKMIHTPLGVDLELFAPKPRARDGIFRVIFVGQITQRKGLSYLIEAFERAALPASELLLVGPIVGSDAPWRATPGVRHVPPVPRAALPDLYATADVYVLPSLAEGFPLTQMEAMAMGLPVIVSEHTSAHDVVTDGQEGYVVPIRDAPAIVDRLRALHDDADLRRSLGAAARLRAEDFGWARYRRRVVDIVAELL
ncbi:MAG: glycosyltransferase family 4 protein [Actinobacteria bacterium]|nr:glycosyltransferase family 4 protein [Actinomycetota bacterium]